MSIEFDFSDLLYDDDELDFSDLLNDDPPTPTPIGKDLVTVLKCTWGRATKTITPDGIVGFRSGKYFDVEQRPCNTLKDLLGILQDLNNDSQRFIIRGKPTGAERKRILRRSKGDQAPFRDDPIHWVCVDIDGEGDAAGTPCEAIERYIDEIPQLEGISVIAQLSSSWGIKPGIRAHLWMWLEEPRTSPQVAKWVASWPVKTDESLYRAVQPHYTAAPRFEGVSDPVPDERVFLISREHDAVYVPSGDIEDETAHWVRLIGALADTGDPRHLLINKAAYSLGGWVGAGALLAADVETTLMDACAESGAFEPERLTSARDEIRRAIADGAKEPRIDGDWKQGLLRNEEGAIRLLPANYALIFRAHPAMRGRLAFDVRSEKILLLAPPPWGKEHEKYPREVVDVDDTEACGWLNRQGIGTSAIYQVAAAISAAAHDNPVDRVVEWLDGLPTWDGVERLDTWMSVAVGCDRDDYHNAISRKFIMSMVARAYEPGCKVDTMPVFVGPQGGRKSTLLAAIAGGPGRWAFSDCLGDIRKPQDYMPTIMGPWLVEVAELATFNRREVETVKKFLSTQVDRYRLSYGHRAVDIPRRCVITGSSNPSDFLSDPSGNRRFWPVEVGAIDVESFIANREQIFAEAKCYYRRGDIWYLTPTEVIAADDVQSYHSLSDPWETLVADFLDAPPIDLNTAAGSVIQLREEVSLADVMIDCLELPPAQIAGQHSRRVSAILRNLGWAKVRSSKPGRPYVYRRQR